MFDDDVCQYKIMDELNPYKIKKYGSRVKGFNIECWRKGDRKIAHKAVLAKFSQNTVPKDMLTSTGDRVIAESS